MSKTVSIHYATPYAIDKNYGRAYNEACEQAPPGSWICLRDGDTMFLNPNWGCIIHAVVADYGEQYDLIGCMMNRLNDTHQLPNGIFSDDPNIKNHMQLAHDLWQQHGTIVTNVPSTRIIAGAFMLFPRDAWECAPFRENTEAFDTWFNRDIRAQGGRVGIMPGLYIFHLYRMWSKADPRHEVAHLK